jgi:biopolymer transport protein ExbD
MLDVVFQLLSFFIMNFHPASVAEGQMDMFLPASAVAKAAEAKDVDPFALSNTEVEPPTEVTVRVEAANGGIGKIMVMDKESQTEIADIKALREELKKVHGQLGNANIKVEADGTLKYAFLIEVMDACLAAKFQSVGFAPPPDLMRR